MKRKLFRKNGAERLDVDEVFFDSFQIKEQDFRWEHRLETPVSSRFMGWLWAGIIILLVFFFGRSFYLTSFKGDYFKALAKQNYIKEEWQRSRRGIIYSSNLTPLVSNISSFNLVVIPAELPRDHTKQELIIRFLQNTFRKDRREIIELFDNINRFSSRPVPLFTNLSREELLLFQSQGEQLEGLKLEENFKREYPNGDAFSHVLGYTGLVSAEDLNKNPDYLLTDLVGKDGLEFTYEDVLKGKHGKVEIETSSVGEEEGIISSTSAEPGKNLILFLDADLQEKLTEVMGNSLKSLGLKKGAAVAIDPRSGGILALQSFPLYDNNIFSERLSFEDFEKLFKDPSQPLFNRAIAGLYPPGSTIKPFMGTAGLEEGVVDENTTVNVTGSITVAGQQFNDWRAHGIVNITRAIAVSSNVFFYTLGGGYGDIDGLGPYRIKDYLSRFGLDAIFGIDLPGEQPGLIPDPKWKDEVLGENWFIGDTYNTSIGQGYVLVTPLGLATALSAITNNGTLIQPRIVKAVADQDLKNVEPTSLNIIGENIASTETLDLIREGMREVILDGSGRALQSLPVTSAGKTGTAQSVEGQQAHAWFTVFAPYENPEIVLVIVVENGGGGTSVSVPIANEVLNWYFNR